MSGILTQLLKHYVSSFRAFDSVTEASQVNMRTLQLALTLELEVDMNNVEEYISAAPEYLKNEELLQLEEIRAADEDERKRKKRLNRVKKFRVKGLATSFRDTEKGSRCH